MNKQLLSTSNQRGMTLIELILVIAIIGLLFNISLPAFDNFVNRSKLYSELSQLRGTLQLARKTAVTQSKKVTLCPTTDGQTCSRGWSDGYMAFVDGNQDRKFNAGDQLLTWHALQEERISLRFRAFGRTSSLQWMQTGITNHQNGTFEICFKEKSRLSRALVITKAGRIRPSSDADGDGIHENASGNNINC